MCNGDFFEATLNNCFKGLTFYEVLIVADLFSWHPIKDSESGVSLCHCSPHNEVLHDDLCAVLRTLRDVASSLKYRFVFYELQDDCSFGIPLDIFRVGMSADFYTSVSKFLTEYIKSMKSPAFRK